MWYDKLIKNEFLINLYNNIPDLNNVRIEELSILNSGNKIKVVFDMPQFADNIPKNG